MAREELLKRLQRCEENITAANAELRKQPEDRVLAMWWMDWEDEKVRLLAELRLDLAA